MHEKHISNTFRWYHRGSGILRYTGKTSSQCGHGALNIKVVFKNFYSMWSWCIENKSGFEDSSPPCMIFCASHGWAKYCLQLLDCMDNQNMRSHEGNNQLTFWNWICTKQNHGLPKYPTNVSVYIFLYYDPPWNLQPAPSLNWSTI
jgi:hypothetical protein